MYCHHRHNVIKPYHRLRRRSTIFFSHLLYGRTPYIYINIILVSTQEACLMAILVECALVYLIRDVERWTERWGKKIWNKFVCLFVTTMLGKKIYICEREQQWLFHQKAFFYVRTDELRSRFSLFKCTTVSLNAFGFFLLPNLMRVIFSLSVI